MARPLTQRQHTVLEAIRTWVRERGYPPTIRELGRLLGIKSLRGVTSHLDAIAKKGFIRREPRARSISLLDLVAPFEQALRVPIIGRIRAGQPVLAQEQIEGHLVIDGAWVRSASKDGASEHFALKVRGERMVSAGILEGDVVIVRHQPTANNGDIIAALFNDEAMVTRYFHEGDHIRLQPEHPTMPPILVPSGQSVSILGKVVAVFRQMP